MPYNKLSELPDNVKESLPVEAQRLWMRVFNSAYRSCTSRNSPNCDDVARAAAWAQVKNKYKKNKDGKWVKR
jgi:cation transport regulator